MEREAGARGGTPGRGARERTEEERGAAVGEGRGPRGREEVEQEGDGERAEGCAEKEGAQSARAEEVGMNA